MMHHAFKIGGIAHYHSHQLLVCDVKLWNFYIVFRFLGFSIGFLQQNNCQQVIWCFDGEYKHKKKCAKQYGQAPFRMKLAEI